MESYDKLSEAVKAEPVEPFVGDRRESNAIIREGGKECQCKGWVELALSHGEDVDRRFAFPEAAPVFDPRSMAICLARNTLARLW